MAKVRRAQEYIRAGDIYQVNLSHRLTARTDGDRMDFFPAIVRRFARAVRGLSGWRGFPDLLVLAGVVSAAQRSADTNAAHQRHPPARSTTRRATRN